MLREDPVPITMNKISYQLTQKIHECESHSTYTGTAHLPEGNKRQVLIKLLQPTLTQDPLIASHLSGFLDVVRGAVHNGLAPLWDFGRAGDYYFIIREYIPGIPLSNILNNASLKRPLISPALAVYITIEMLQTLQALHRFRVTGEHPIFLFHGGLSPENIIITRVGNVVLTDMGLDVIFWRNRKVVEKIIQHKHHYHPPEYKKGNRPMRRGDTYGLASLLYQMTTGAPLGDVLTAEEHTTPIPPASAYSPHVTEDFDQLMLACLHPDPEKRETKLDNLLEGLRAPALLKQAQFKERKAMEFLESLTQEERYQLDRNVGELLFDYPFQIESLLPERPELDPPYKRYRLPLHESTGPFHPSGKSGGNQSIIIQENDMRTFVGKDHPFTVANAPMPTPPSSEDLPSVDEHLFNTDSVNIPPSKNTALTDELEEDEVHAPEATQLVSRHDLIPTPTHEDTTTLAPAPTAPPEPETGRLTLEDLHEEPEDFDEVTAPGKLLEDIKPPAQQELPPLDDMINAPTVLRPSELLDLSDPNGPSFRQEESTSPQSISHDDIPSANTPQSSDSTNPHQTPLPPTQPPASEEPIETLSPLDEIESSAPHTFTPTMDTPPQAPANTSAPVTGRLTIEDIHNADNDPMEHTLDPKQHMAAPEAPPSPPPPPTPPAEGTNAQLPPQAQPNQDDEFERFGKFVLLNRVALGGMAEVFRAKSEGIDGFQRLIAIKRILPEYSQDHNFIEMFKDEARIAGSLLHPHIVQIHELGEIDGTYFISMEFIDGIDMARVIKLQRALNGTIPQELAVTICIAVCRALHYAHEAKDLNGNPLSMIHRDVTPHNVLLSRKGEIKLTDFGIAKASQNVSKTAVGELKGKLSYMSPEQSIGAKIDRRTDVFQVGILLFEMLTLQKMFEGTSDHTILTKIQTGQFPSLRKLAPGTPQELEDIVMKALASAPEDRYQTAEEMEKAFVRFRDQLRVPPERFEVAPFVAHILKQRDILMKQYQAARQQRQKHTFSIWDAQSSPQTNPGQSMADLSLLDELPDALPPKPPSKPLPWKIIGLTTTLLLLLGLGGIVGYMLLFSKQEPPKVLLSVSSNPIGAIVKLDGVVIGKTPIFEKELAFNLDQHVIQLSKPTYKTVTRSFRFQKQSGDVNIAVMLPRQKARASRQVLQPRKQAPPKTQPRKHPRPRARKK
tara:strand:+ start:2615 stop:6160 length:3546 start_codon:yes stop_codon:yes gene_type:complete